MHHFTNLQLAWYTLVFFAFGFALGATAIGLFYQRRLKQHKHIIKATWNYYSDAVPLNWNWPKKGSN